MLRVSADHYVNISERLLDIQVGILFDPEFENGDSEFPKNPSDEDTQQMVSSFHLISNWCDDLGLSSAAISFREAMKDPPRTTREFRFLKRAFESDLRSKFILSLRPERAAYFDGRSVLTSEAKSAFPMAFEELRMASRAHALEMDTACVFHCMRALEPALAALAEEVGEAVGSDVWQSVITRIESKVASLAKTLPKGEEKANRLQFLGQAAAELTYFKDGWRNHVSHGRGLYTEDDARRVFDHVRHFVERLSARSLTRLSRS